MSSHHDRARSTPAPSKSSSHRAALNYLKQVQTPHSANAIAGPSRLPTATSISVLQAKSVALQSTERAESLVGQSMADSDEDEVDIAVINEVLLRAAAALIPGGKPCRWSQCDVKLASHDKWLKHALLHAEGQQERDSNDTSPLRCRWVSCRDLYDDRQDLREHLLAHTLRGAAAHPSAWRASRYHSLLRNALDAMPSKGRAWLPSANPCFTQVPRPPSPPPIPESYRSIPSYLLPGVVTPADNQCVSDHQKARIAPRNPQSFQPGCDAQSWNLGSSSSFYRLTMPFHAHQVPEDGQSIHESSDSGSDIEEPFEPTHNYMPELYHRPRMPSMAPAPTLVPTTGAIQITKRNWKGRSALNISADVLLMQGTLGRKREVTLSADEALDRRAARNADASFGFAFQYERLRLQGKMDEESPEL